MMSAAYFQLIDLFFAITVYLLLTLTAQEPGSLIVQVSCSRKLLVH